MTSKSRNNRTRYIRKFHALLTELNLHQQKANLLAGFNVTSTKDLDFESLLTLIQRLEDLRAKKNDTPPIIRRWRGINIDLLTKLGIYKGKDSWGAVNDFLNNPRIAKKPMYEMNLNELKQLSYKLRAILNKDEEKKRIVELENLQAKWN